MGLPQTAQASDELDQRFEIWDEVFTDSVDIHQRAKNRNVYEPVLFRLNLDVLDNEEIAWVSVTKKNPTKWVDGEEQSERWFISLEEVRSDFVKGRFDQMFVFRCQNGELDISRTLEEVKVDGPGVSVREGLHLFSLGLGALCLARIIGGLTSVPIRKRSCPSGCECGTFYRNTHLRDAVMKLFDPRESG